MVIYNLLQILKWTFYGGGFCLAMRLLRPRVKVGIYRYQQFEFNQYVCSTPPNGQAFRYTRESLLNSDPAQEDIEFIVVTFPNDFERKVTREELKENSPFAPKGVLNGKEAILIIGKIKLSKEDSDRLKEVF